MAGTCPQGIRVNAINPATVVTNFFTSAGMSHDQAQAYMSKSAKTHPIGRVGTPADIAELCYFLTDGSKAGWITGQVSILGLHSMSRTTIPSRLCRFSLARSADVLSKQNTLDSYCRPDI